MKKFGSTAISKINSQKDMDEFVEALEIKGEAVVLKPNWVDAEIGSHNEAKSLDMFLTSLKKHVIFVESYTFWRTEKMFTSGEDYFSSSEATVETGKIHWQHFKDQDRWFLEHEGLDQVLEKHEAEYVNITNEVWAGETANPKIIKEIVEAKYSPLRSQEFYSRIPKKLYDLRGADFVSFAKAKLDAEYGATLTIKNIFGLIPDPKRGSYHRSNPPDGPEDKLVDSIIDMNKIYQALFNPIFVVDGLQNTGIMDWEINKMRILNPDWRVMIGGKNGLEVDSLSIKLMGSEFKDVMLDMPIKYEETFKSHVDFNSLPANIDSYKL